MAKLCNVRDRIDTVLVAVTPVIDRDLKSFVGGEHLDRDSSFILHTIAIVDPGDDTPAARPSSYRTAASSDEGRLELRLGGRGRPQSFDIALIRYATRHWYCLPYTLHGAIDVAARQLIVAYDESQKAGERAAQTLTKLLSQAAALSKEYASGGYRLDRNILVAPRQVVSLDTSHHEPICVHLRGLASRDVQ